MTQATELERFFAFFPTSMEKCDCGTWPIARLLWSVTYVD